MYTHSNAHKVHVSSSLPSSSPLAPSPSSIFTSPGNDELLSSPLSSPPQISTPTPATGVGKRGVTRQLSPSPLLSAENDTPPHSFTTPGVVSPDANISRRLFTTPVNGSARALGDSVQLSSTPQLSDAVREAYFPGIIPPRASHVTQQEIPLPSTPHSVMGIRGTSESESAGLARGRSTPSSRRLPWKRDGRVSSRILPVALELPDMSFSQSEEWSWNDVLGEINEVADRVCQEVEETAEKLRDKTSFQPLILPITDSATNFSTPMPGREKILKVNLTKPAEYFAPTAALNEERSRRAICLDDPDASPIPVPHLSKQKNKKKEVSLPLHQSLKNKLPSPSVFRTKLAPKVITKEEGESETEVRLNVYTAVTYRSKHDDIGDIERASAGPPNMPYEDKHFGARVAQYRKNKELLEAAMSKKSRIDAPYPPATSKKAMYQKRGGTKSTKSGTVGPSFQTHILRSWELARDIERLEALKHSVAEARIRIDQVPWIWYSDIQEARRSCRCKVTDSDDEGAREYLANGEVESVLEVETISSIFEAVSIPGTQLHRSVDLADVCVLDQPRGDDDAEIFSDDGMSSGLDEEDPEFETGTVASRRPTSVSSDRGSFLESGFVTPVAESVQLNTAGTQEQEKNQSLRTGSQRSASLYSTQGSITPVGRPTQHKLGEAKKPEVDTRDRDRAEALEIMRGLGSVSKRIDRSEPPSMRVFIDEQEMRRDDAISQNFMRQEEERYPKMKNMVQQ